MKCRQLLQLIQPGSPPHYLDPAAAPETMLPDRNNAAWHLACPPWLMSHALLAIYNIRQQGMSWLGLRWRALLFVALPVVRLCGQLVFPQPWVHWRVHEPAQAPPSTATRHTEIQARPPEVPVSMGHSDHPGRQYAIKFSGQAEVMSGNTGWQFPAAPCLMECNYCTRTYEMVREHQQLPFSGAMTRIERTAEQK